MNFPELIYQPTPYEISKADLNPIRVAHVLGNSGLAVQRLLRTAEVPADRVFILQSATLEAEAGAAQLVTQIFFNITADPTFANQGRIASTYVNAQFGALNFSGAVYLLPGETLTMLANFSAAAASNSIDVGYTGLLVPRANFQFGRLALG